jgi:sugar phosphate isomerase/epimerase
MKHAGAFDRSNHKRRDEFVDYVEKAIKLGHQLGHRDAVLGPGSGAKAARK